MTKQDMNKKYPKRRGFYYFDNPIKELEGEIVLPSVTAILGVIAKPALIHWASRTAADIALDNPSLSLEEVSGRFNGVKKQAAEKGKRIHTMFQTIIDLDDQETFLKHCDKDDKLYAEPIFDFINEYKFEHQFGERIVRSFKFGYAGTCDEGGLVNGKLSILDLKTGKNTYPEHRLQLEAYKEALIEEGFKVKKTYILHVPGDGTFTLEETKDDFTVFLHLKKVYEWTKKKGD